MIDIKNKRCIQEKCNLEANFNIQNQKNGLYCNEHKKDNMINVRCKKCKDENCNKQPNFNYINEKVGIYCSKHKKAVTVF